MNILDQIEGLQPVDPAELAAYEREMTEHAIPEIVRAVERRRMLAAESRHRKLELPTVYDHDSLRSPPGSSRDTNDLSGTDWLPPVLLSFSSISITQCPGSFPPSPQ